MIIFYYQCLSLKHLCKLPIAVATFKCSPFQKCKNLLSVNQRGAGTYKNLSTVKHKRSRILQVS